MLKMVFDYLFLMLKIFLNVVECKISKSFVVM